MRTSLVTIASLLAFSAVGAFAQSKAKAPSNRVKIDQPAKPSEGGDSAKPEKAGRVKVPGIPQISVIDKLLSVESALSAKLKRQPGDEGAWVSEYEKMYQEFRRDGRLNAIAGEGNDSTANAMALGIKASDAVLALKARNVEALNTAAEQINVLAKKLGATDNELGMANTVKSYANKKQWFGAFYALGRLQRDVTNYLESSSDKAKRDLAMLVVVGGWLQGGRCVTSFVDANYDAYVSNVLREQRLVDIIIETLASLDPKYDSDALVADIRKALPEIRKRVDVGMDSPVKQADVKWLHDEFEKFVIRVAPKK